MHWKKNAYVCGTLRLDRGVPMVMRGKNAWRKESSLTVIKVKFWYKYGEIRGKWNLISTLHRAECGTEKKKRKGETMKKPEVIQDYNKFTRGVNRADQILHYYPCFGKTAKWTKKCTFFLLHVAAQNSFTLFRKYTTHQNQMGKGYAFRHSYLTAFEKWWSRHKETTRTIAQTMNH